jgi:hypothetical protein
MIRNGSTGWFHERQVGSDCASANDHANSRMKSKEMCFISGRGEESRARGVYGRESTKQRTSANLLFSSQ